MRNTRTSFIIFTFLCGSLMLLAACSASNPVSVPSVNDIINKAKQVDPQAEAYNTTIDTTIGSTKTSLQETVSYTTTPKRTHINLTTTNAGQTTTIETIADDSADYVKLNGTWQKGPATPGTNDPSTLDINKSVVGALSNVSLVGTENVNGRQTYHLHGTGTSTTAGITGTYQEDVWIRTDNYYVAKVTGQGTGTESGQQTSSTFNILLTGWDNDVKIDLPQV